MLSGSKKRPPLAFRQPDLEPTDTVEMQEMTQKFRNDLEKFKDTKSKFLLARPLSSRHSVNLQIHDFSLLNESKAHEAKKSQSKAGLLGTIDLGVSYPQLSERSQGRRWPLKQPRSRPTNFGAETFKKYVKPNQVLAKPAAPRRKRVLTSNYASQETLFGTETLVDHWVGSNEDRDPQKHTPLAGVFSGEATDRLLSQKFQEYSQLESQNILVNPFH